MPDCDYCGDSFSSEKAYHKHLRSEHADELGPIDRRRVGAVEGDDDGLPTGPIALVAVVGLAVVVVGYVTFVAGGGNNGQPHSMNSVHYHGTMNVTVMGDQVDFSQRKYQVQDRAFHFEAGNGEMWHVHAQGVTLTYAVESLGFGITKNSFTYNGTTYRDGQNAEVIIQVNGKSVNPDKFVIDRGVSEQAARNGKGPHVRIVVKKA